MTAGIAAARPIAVAINASAIPGATTERSVLRAPPIDAKALMIPHTVQNNPIKGVALAVVARKERFFSITACSLSPARVIALSTISWERAMLVFTVTPEV